MKTEKYYLRLFVGGLFFVLLSSVAFTAQAAMVATPVVGGYGAGFYKAASSSFSVAANGASYGATAVTEVAGKSITMPATLRMAANAGRYALDGMRLTPLGIVGTLAAGWLLDQGLQYLDGQWKMNKSGKWVWKDGNFVSNVFATPDAACKGYAASIGDDPSLYSTSATGGNCYRLSQNKVGIYTYQAATGQSLIVPALPTDWDALPDPIPTVAPELPNAPYMPQGVPVEAPEFDFAPMSVPIGQPYTRPNGSTAQPMAKVSPNGKQVTIDTYDQPLTTPAGDPVTGPDAAPQDTPDPAPPPEKGQCEKYPDTLGCAKLDTPAAEDLGTQNRNISMITPISVGGAGTCPAPLTASFLGQTVSMSFDPLCQFANSLRPLVLALAWLSAGLIFIGGVRS